MSRLMRWFSVASAGRDRGIFGGGMEGVVEVVGGFFSSETASLGARDWFTRIGAVETSASDMMVQGRG